MKHLNSQRSRKGQAVIEMAIVVTVLLFLTVGLIQYGLIATARVGLTNVAREGARYAALNKTANDSTIKTEIINRVAATSTVRDLTTSNLVISWPNGRTEGNPVIFTVNYDMRRRFIVPSYFPGLAGFGTNTSARAEMIIQGSST